jgi:hypothetical protein
MSDNTRTHCYALDSCRLALAWRARPTITSPVRVLTTPGVWAVLRWLWKKPSVQGGPR